jgi:hypothetical protein
MRRQYLAPLGAILLLAASVTCWAQSTAYETVFKRFERGLSPRAALRVPHCGQNNENGTIYLSPTAITDVEPALADATCDGLDGATEATQDLVVLGYPLRPIYMRCILNGTLAAGESVVWQLRGGEADVPGFTCGIGAGQTTCHVLSRGRIKVEGSVPTAIRAVQVSNNADDDSKCVLIYAFD